MDVKKILMPDGKMYTYFRGDDQTWDQIIREKVLPDWEAYCNSHWIDHNNHESMWSFEKHTKSFLDRCAWLWLQDFDDKPETRYKEMIRKVREIPVSECSDGISDLLYSDRQPPIETNDLVRDESSKADVDKGWSVKKPTSKHRIKTKYQKIEDIKKKYGNAKRKWCVVDEDNVFTYGGYRIKIPDYVEAYVEKKGSDYGYRMDRILVVDDGDYHYFDQNVNPVSF